MLLNRSQLSDKLLGGSFSSLFSGKLSLCPTMSTNLGSGVFSSAPKSTRHISYTEAFTFLGHQVPLSVWANKILGLKHDLVQILGSIHFFPDFPV